jgi:acyl-CoA synthetase (NDP forming)
VPTVSALADALVVAGTNPAVTGLVGPRLGLVSISGAAGVIGSDRVAQHPDLRVAHLDEDARRTLGERLDERLVPANPIDVPFIDDTRPFADALISFADSEAIDVVVGIESGLAHDRGVLRDRLVDLQEHSPIVLTSLSEDDQIPSAIVAELAAAGIPYLPTVDRAVDAIAACATRQAGEADIPVPVLEGDKEVQGLEWIRALVPDDFPWAQWCVIDDDADAETAAAEFGFPLALKAAGRTIVHRTEHGAVKVVRTPANLIGAYRSVAAVCAEHDDAVIAQAFAPTGFELLVSALRDPEVGPVAIVRPGGTFAEMMSAQAVIWGGWAPERRRANLRSSSLWELLDGYRGGERYDTEAVLDLVDRALDLVASTISFIEMNPAVASASGVYVVDCIARK